MVHSKNFARTLSVQKIAMGRVKNLMTHSTRNHYSGEACFWQRFHKMSVKRQKNSELQFRCYLSSLTQPTARKMLFNVIKFSGESLITQIFDERWKEETRQVTSKPSAKQSFRSLIRSHYRVGLSISRLKHILDRGASFSLNFMNYCWNLQWAYSLRCYELLHHMHFRQNHFLQRISFAAFSQGEFPFDSVDLIWNRFFQVTY